MKNLFPIFIAMLILTFPLSQAFAGDAGQTAAEFLRLGPGGDIPAMGGAGVASVAGPSALQYNPAGLASARSRDLEFTYQQLVEDIGYGNLDYTHKLDSRGMLGAGLRYVSYGTEDRTVLDGGSVTRDGSFSGSDLLISGGYGEAFAGEYAGGRMNWGAAMKIGRLEIDDETANLWAIDAGLQWHSLDHSLPLSAGVVLANLGTDVNYDDKDEDLPLLSRLGVTYDLQPQLDWPARLHADIEYQFESGESGLLLGGEYLFDVDQFRPNSQLAIRAGYDGNVDVDGGLTAGFGFRVNDRMGLDYAYVPFGDFGNLHKIGFRYHLGGK